MYRFLIVVGASLLVPSMGLSQSTLEETLRSEPMARLVADVEANGNASRGAVLFHQQALTCVTCHGPNGRGGPLGPDLTDPAEKRTTAEIVESLLDPSAKVRRGFETEVVILADGRSVQGLVREETGERLVLLDAARPGERLEIAKDDIDERGRSDVSIMPKGLVNLLPGREAFWDLAAYVAVISEGGPSVAEELAPHPSTYARPPIPEYENDIDHAGMLADLGSENLKRGEAIYERVCANCHGTLTQAGSLPAAPRFASAVLKQGSDPYRMYQTLTHGWGLMAPQPWMVPRQKYDVIHFIREHYLREQNPAQYASVDSAYLDTLPKGSTRGPEPSAIDDWNAMDYGDSLMATIEVGDDGKNIAYKGLAIRLDAGVGGVARGSQWALYELDTLRLAGVWTGTGFVDWRGVLFNGQHGVHPRAVGTVLLANPDGPGWADPRTGSFDDQRLVGRDGRRYGPMPRSWGRLLGVYHHGQDRVLRYKIGETEVLESPMLVTHENIPVIYRRFEIGPRTEPMTLQVARVQPTSPLRVERTQERSSAHWDEQNAHGVAIMSPPMDGADWRMTGDGDLRLALPASGEPVRFCIATATGDDLAALTLPGDGNLSKWIRGGPPRWGDRLPARIERTSESGPFVVESLNLPTANPWNARVRPTGFDFFDDGDSVAVCTWDGDVWLARGLASDQWELVWQRIASGLFQPLGLRIVRGAIYVNCRDQIAILHDHNGDGETDEYECFNSDHQVTEHFHEFAMGLQTDSAGNFYYAKSARHAKEALVPQHGTLLRVSADGERTEILATGFRAANGVCLNPDGSFIVTDQEGHWNPKNRINWIRKPGAFFGNMWGYHDVSDASDDAMEPPLCWITNEFDRSPAELLWVDAPGWGPLEGSLLNLSYGYGKIFVVPHEEVDGVMQGGMAELPIPMFPAGLVRGRFHPKDHELYVCGLSAWATSRTEPGGFYRIRPSGSPIDVPIGLHAHEGGITLTFSNEVDPQSVSKESAFQVKTWEIHRTAEYGSEHFNVQSLDIESAVLGDDGRTVELAIPKLKPTWCMEIRYRLASRDQRVISGRVHNTIHRLGKRVDADGP